MLRDPFENGPGVGKELFVGEAENCVTHCCQISVAARVVLFTALMDRAIQFDDKSRFVAVKICDAISYLMLPPKFEAMKSPVSKVFP